MNQARLAAVLLTALLPAIAQASSDEAWLERAKRPPESRPLLALLVDTSAAMGGQVDVPLPYDPGRDYVAVHPGTPCRSDRVYWRRGPGALPDCTSPQWVSLTSGVAARGWRCHAGDSALATTGVFVAGRAAQWDPGAGGGYWRQLEPGDDGAVECREDRGRHGAAEGTWFAADGDRGPWLTSAADEPQWDAPPLSDAYVFFAGNYLNYVAAEERVGMTRLGWLARRLVDAARSVAGLEFALARLSHDGLGGDDEGRGGMIVLAPVVPPEAAPAIDSVLQGWVPAGPAPLAEALAETLRWLAGAPLHFGLDTHVAPTEPLPSAAGVRDATNPTQYLTPFTHACRPVLLGVATAGTPSADGSAAAALGGLSWGGTDPACPGDCLARVTRRIAGGDLRNSSPGTQRADVRVLAPPASLPALATTIEASGHAVLDLDDQHALVMLVAHALQNDAAVGVRSRISGPGLEYAPFAVPDASVYYGVSATEPVPPWPGNLRRYRLAQGGTALAGPAVIDADGANVFDPVNGSITADSRSEWSDLPDGGDVTLGGAAARLPAPDARNVFTDLTTEPLLAPSNRFAADNPALTRERLALGPGDPRTVADLVAWTLARDAFDQDADGDHDETRPGLGDPGMDPPRILRYAAGAAARAFVATQDGLLHAIDADSGEERWAFLPAAMLPRLADFAPGFRSISRRHGLDGPLSLAWSEADQDDRLDPGGGDRAWLVAGLGRGGTGYFALDVSDPDEPRLVWSLGADDLPGFGQSWPPAVLGRMRLANGQERRVALLTGGFDPSEDGTVAPSRSRGAGLAVVDLESGRILWRAGAAAVGPDLEVPSMQRSVVVPARALDSDGDGLVDRVYLLDIGGLLLRLDFPRGELGGDASAKLLARLGAGSVAATRRFLAAPDIVPVGRNGSRQLAIATGSGWLSRPRSTAADDAFFVVFDARADGPASVPLAPPDLADVTPAPHEAPPDAPGWMLRLTRHGDGEKTAGAAFTFDHRLRFTTYQPLPAAADAPCGPPAGISRLYTLDVRNGRPVNWIGDQPVPDEDIATTGLPSTPGVIFPAGAGAPCAEGACGQRPFALTGGHAVDLGFSSDPVRTSWRQLDVNAQ